MRTINVWLFLSHGKSVAVMLQPEDWEYIATKGMEKMENQPLVVYKVQQLEHVPDKEAMK